MFNLREIVTTYIGVIFKIGLTLIILSTLFLFANLTTEFYETPKFLSLLIFTGVLLILLSLKFTFLGRVVFIRTPLDIPLLLILVVAVVSTFLSPAPFVSLLGNQPRVHGGLAALIVYILFYFVLVNSLKGGRETKWIIGFTTVSASIVSIISLIAYSGVKILPDPWSHGVNFTPTGSSFSSTAIFAMLLPFAVVGILQSTKPVFKIVNSVILFLLGVTIALTGNFATWIAAVLGLSLALVTLLRPIGKVRQIGPISLISLITPLVLVALVVVLSFIPPIGGANNPLYEKAKNFPRELQLPFIPSWKVSVSAFRDAPFWGTGPATYIFNFTQYKPIEYNQTSLWNLRFDSAFNEYLEVLANLGGVGLIGLLSLSALFISAAYKVIFGSSDDFQKALGLSGLTFFTILTLHSSTLPIWIFGLLVLAAFFVSNLSEDRERGWNSITKIAGNVWGTDSSKETVRIDALPGILLVISVSLVLVGFFFGGKFALADYHHRLALNAVAANQGIVAYNELIKAEQLNPQNDLYRTDLAQTNFALANAIATAKGPTEASPGGSLTQQDQENIQVLLQQSINEGRNAVTLSPRSAVNWEILGLLYRQIAGVAQNALAFSLDSYGRAILQDPLNPLLRLNVGGTYYAIGNYDLAIRFFTDAINLKPDFANGYYNLSVALRDKGDLAGAIAAAQRVLELVEADSEDYKVAEQYLTDLKNKSESQTTPPAAETSGALKEEGLPKVIDLPKPENIATPSAVKKPNSTPEPTPNP